VEKHDALITLAEIIIPVSVALEEIDDWSYKAAASGAHSLLGDIQSSTFLVTLSLLAEVMASSLVLSRALQKVQLDRVTATAYADRLRSKLIDMRGKAEEEFAKIYMRAAELARKLGVSLEKPRTSGRQRFRANMDAYTAEDYFERAVYIPFLDNFILQLQVRNQRNLLERALSCSTSVFC